MKKFCAVLMSVFTLALSGMLMACSFKGVEAKFTQDELVVYLSDDKTVDFGSYLNVKNADIGQIDFQFSDGTIFDKVENGFKAKKYGTTKVFATYNKNSLASMNVVVGKPFEAPSNFKMSIEKDEQENEIAVITWDESFAMFETDSVEDKPTFAKTYIIEGQKILHNAENPDETEGTSDFYKEVSAENDETPNKLVLTEIGEYHLSFKAKKFGHFDDSEVVTPSTFFFGFMPQLTIENGGLNWNGETGELSWSSVVAGENAKYKVRMNGIELGDYQTETTMDLSNYFDEIEQGQSAEVSVVVYDSTGEKWARESEILKIKKLNTPNVSYNFSAVEGGLFKVVTDENADKYVFTASTDVNSSAYVFEKKEQTEIYTDLPNLASGEWKLSVVAVNSNKGSAGEFFYHSDSVEFEKIYKLPKIETVTARENDIDGNLINLTFTSNAPLVSTKIGIDGLGIVGEGFSQGAQTVETSLNFSEVGKKLVKLKQIPVQQDNNIGENSVFVLNSALSEELTFIKLAQIKEGILHKYKDEKSVFSFKAVENATNYELQRWNGETFEKVDDSLYTVKLLEEGQVEIELSSRIEVAILPVEEAYRLRVVAIAGEENFVIKSSTEKSLQILKTPTSVSRSDETQMLYTWGQVEGANEYRLEYYEFLTDDGKPDKNSFEECVVENGLPDKKMTIETCSTNNFTFSHEGYFYVEVFAISNNENVTLSSGGLKQKICIAKKIEFEYDAENFKFGYDESLKEQGMTKATGYFVELKNLNDKVTSVDAYSVVSDDISTKCAETAIVEGSESLKLVLTEGFDNEGAVKLKVQAKNTDSRLYLTSEIVLQVTRLAKVHYADIELDNRTENVTIRKKDGVSEIVVSQNGRLLSNTSEDTTIKIIDEEGNYVKFSLNINLKGSNIDGNYFDIGQENQDSQEVLTTFLESGESTIDFQRLSTPTNFEYNNGKLVFNHEQSSATKYYVVDIVCVGVNGDSKSYTVRFDTQSVSVDGYSHDFGPKVDYVEESEDNKISINIQSFIDKLNQVEDLSAEFAQADSIKFRAFAYQNIERDNDDSKFVQISSLFAKSASSETTIEVKKFDEVVPTFSAEGQTYTLSWNSATVGGEALNSQQLTNVEYEIYLLNEKGDDTLIGKVSANTFTNFTSEYKEAEKFFTFYIKVSHPQFLTSNESSYVKIYKLKSLDKVTLTDSAQLLYNAPEADYTKAVKVESSGRTISEDKLSGSVEIDETGTKYDFTILGKKLEQRENPEQEEQGKLLCTTYYIDSEVASWTVKEMNGEDVKPSNDEINFAGNIVSWNPYGVEKNLPSLEYVLIFKDSLNKIVTYRTENTSVNLTDAEDKNAQKLLEDLKVLNAGEITVSLSAHLKPYSAVAGDIYFAKAQKLLNTEDEGVGECNHYIYNASAKTQKLAIPEIGGLEYVYDDSNPLNAQYPNVKISLKGDYNQTGTFEIYRVASTGREFLRKESVSKEIETYSFTLESSEIANYLSVEHDLIFEIFAVSEGDNAQAFIPSSALVLTLKRAHDLEAVEFKEEQIGYSKVVKFSYNTEYAQELAKGVILKVDIFNNDALSSVKVTKAFFVPFSGEELGSEGQFEYDLGENQASWFNENLSSGGIIKVSAFVNNSAENSRYFLASVGGPQTNPSGMKESEPYEVLASVGDENIVRASNGFKITGGKDNKVAYFVKNNAEINIVKANADGEFVFDAPDNWENGQFNLKVMATHETEVISTQTKYYVSSVEKEVSFTMRRIERVDSETVQIERLDDEMSLIWKAVDNAEGYVLRIYKLSNGEKGELLYTYETDSSYVNDSGRGGNYVKRKLFDIFGESYENLIGAGKFSELELQSGDCDVWFELVTVGDGENYNNSHDCTFSATIVGNPIEKEDVSISMGRIYLSNLKEGQKLMYRYIVVEGTQIRPIQAWRTTTVLNSTSVVLEIDLKEEIYQAFNIEIVIIGEGPASHANFVLDSMPYSSYGEFGFYKVNDILDIQYNPNNPDGITFTLDTLDDTNFLYVGQNGNSLDRNEVVSIKLTNGEMSSSGLGVDFRYSLLDILTALNEKVGNIELSANMSLTFWAYKESTEEALYLASKPKEYKFSYIEDIYFKEVVKLGKDAASKGDGTVQEDFVNTYVLFDNKDDADKSGFITSGFYVKLKQGEFIDSVFVSKEELLANPYFGTDTFAINLVEHVFNNKKLEGQSGMFEVEFAKVATKGDLYCVSEWISTDKNGKKFQFSRYRNVSSIIIRGGNLSWAGVDAEQYYVFFVSNILDESPTSWAYIKTKSTTVDTSKMPCDETRIFVAVQAVCEDTNNLSVVSSARTYYGGVDGEPIMVRRNQVKESVVNLDDKGRLYIDWDKDGKFFNLLTKQPDGTTSLSMIAEELASENTIFEEPFTFTLKDLLEENMLYLRLRFTPIGEDSDVKGYSRSYDIPIVELMSSLIDFYSQNAKGNLRDRIEELVEATTLGSSKATLMNFYERIEKASRGLGGPALFIDDCLNTLQAGKYKLEYCLLGNAFSLNSYMYSYENAKGTNEIFINEEPDVTIQIDRTKSQEYTTVLKVTVKKSKVWTYDEISSGYVQKDAEGYYIKIGEAYFSLIQSSGWRIQCLSNSSSFSTLSVTENGDSLEFYINYNSGESLLGKFENEIERSAPKEFQICAIGTKYSLSSKSEMFLMTLLELKQFQIRDGQFTWQTQQNRDTYVIYKQTGAVEDSRKVSGDLANPVFSLSGIGSDGAGAGSYEYIRFLLIGGVTGNTVYVDSDMLQVKNVFKLYSPNLENNLGKLYIRGNEENRNALANSYSDTDKYVYNLYNDSSTSGLTYLQICDEKEYFGFEYEVGVVPGLEPNSPEGIFKATEFSAKMFYAESLGSSASFVKGEAETTSSYYIKNLKCVDSKTGEETSGNIIVKSDVGSLPAIMLDKIDEESLKIENGLINFKPVSERKMDETSYTIPTDALDVYRIRIERYKTSDVEGADTRVGTEKDIETFYTSAKSNGNVVFDFLNLKENPELDTEDVLYKVYVQATALQKGLSSVPLVEGGYAGGSAKYYNYNYGILMSEPVVLKGIKRIKPIDENSLKVNENGLLTWTYRPSETSVAGETLSPDNIEYYYRFVVADVNGNEYSGIKTITMEDGVYTITFEESGDIPVGTNNLQVYVTVGEFNPNSLLVNSVARTKEFTKLEGVYATNFEVMSVSGVEYLSFERYFSDFSNKTNTIIAHFEDLNMMNGAVTKDVTFTNNENKLYIFKNNVNLGDVSWPEGYVQDYVIITKNDISKVWFEVRCEGKLNSNASESFMLHRTDVEDVNIVWDSVKQEFSWNYQFNSFNSKVKAEKLKYVYSANEGCLLYGIDGDFENPSDKTVTKGEVFEIAEDDRDKDYLKIVKDDEYFFVKRSDVTRTIEDDIENGVIKTQDFDGSVLVKILETQGDYSIVEIENVPYRVATTRIEKPTFVIEATYIIGDAQTVRTYNSKESSFKPTIISTVKLKVRVKLNQTSIQSDEKEYFDENDEDGNGSPDSIEFNLFESGQGTDENPYIITNSTQFKNIKYRLSKELTEYSENGIQHRDSSKYYFSIQVVDGEELELGSFSGVLIDGVFDGVLRGNGTTITYTSTDVVELKEEDTISIEASNSAISNGSGGPFKFRNVTALFREIKQDAEVRNLHIKAHFEKEQYVDNHSLVSGLAIINNGTIDSVVIDEFSTNFVGYIASNTLITMSYSGIASINRGTLRNCVFTAQTEIVEERAQNIFIAGLVYTNYSTIEGGENCNTSISSSLSIHITRAGSGGIQIAGIAITNSNGKINARNNASISVLADSSSNSITCYAGGVVVLQKGNLDLSTDSTTTPTVTGIYNATVDKIYATRRAGG